MKKRLFFLFIFFVAANLSAQSGSAVLKNRFIEVSVDASTACFSVTDLRSGQIWSQSDKKNIKLSDVRVSGNHLEAVFNACLSG
jgi:hypothetical protein